MPRSFKLPWLQYAKKVGSLGSNVLKRFTALLQKIDTKKLDNTPISYILCYKV